MLQLYSRIIKVLKNYFYAIVPDIDNKNQKKLGKHTLQKFAHRFHFRKSEKKSFFIVIKFETDRL